jgi:hypothetical protein
MTVRTCFAVGENEPQGRPDIAIDFSICPPCSAFAHCLFRNQRLPRQRWQPGPREVTPAPHPAASNTVNHAGVGSYYAGCARSATRVPSGRFHRSDGDVDQAPRRPSDGRLTKRPGRQTSKARVRNSHVPRDVSREGDSSVYRVHVVNRWIVHVRHDGFEHRLGDLLYATVIGSERDPS